MSKYILLVEDDQNDLELALFALERAQLTRDIATVRDGAEALDYLFRRNAFAERAAGNPAVVLLDLKMPKVDGLAVLEAIRADEELQHIPVAMLSSSRIESDLNHAYALGVNAYVVKPVDFKQFVSTVSDLGLFWVTLNEPPLRSTRI
jgi:CheY-like chemotaxis protein